MGVQAGGDVSVYQVALEGDESWTPLLTGERAVMLQSAQAGKLLYLVSEINHPIDLCVADADGSDETAVDAPQRRMAGRASSCPASST